MNKNERNLHIKELHTKLGYTLESIGKKYGITRERVRQILGGSSRKELIEAIEIQDSYNYNIYQLSKKIIKKYPGFTKSTAKRIIAKHNHKTKSPTGKIGDKGERLVFEKLLKMGFDPKMMKFGHPFDIEVNGIRIDVKTCKTPIYSNKDYDNSYYHFMVYKKTKVQKSDFFVLVALDTKSFWVVPYDVIPNVDSVYINTQTPKWNRVNFDIYSYQDRWSLLRK